MIVAYFRAVLARSNKIPTIIIHSGTIINYYNVLWYNHSALKHNYRAFRRFMTIIGLSKWAHHSLHMTFDFHNNLTGNFRLNFKESLTLYSFLNRFVFLRSNFKNDFNVGGGNPFSVEGIIKPHLNPLVDRFSTTIIPFICLNHQRSHRNFPEHSSEREKGSLPISATPSLPLLPAFSFSVRKVCSGSLS